MHRELNFYFKQGPSPNDIKKGVQTKKNSTPLGAYSRYPPNDCLMSKTQSLNLHFTITHTTASNYSQQVRYESDNLAF